MIAATTFSFLRNFVINNLFNVNALTYALPRYILFIFFIYFFRLIEKFDINFGERYPFDINFGERYPDVLNCQPAIFFFHKSNN